MIFYHIHSWILYPSMISWNVLKNCFIFSFTYSIFITLIATMYQLGWIQYTTDTSSFKDLLNIFSFFFFMGLGFRLNTAYASWSNGIDMVIKIMHQSINIVNTLHDHLRTNDKKYNENNVVLNQFKHYVLEYVSLLFNIPKNEITRRRSTLDIFRVDSKHYLTNSEVPSRCTSNSTLEEQLPYQRMYTRIESDIKKNIYQNKLQHYFSDSQHQYLHQSIDQLFAYRVMLYKLQNIPPVCIYIQLFDFYMYTYLFLYGLTIIPISTFYSGIWTFVLGFIISLALNVAREIDTPFGDDKNDIQMDIIIKNIRKEIEVITFLLK